MNPMEKRQNSFPPLPGEEESRGLPTSRRRDYIKRPYFCPFCEHRAIEATTIMSLGTLVFQQVRCDGCEKEWVDTYELIDYEEM
jgi:transcription elongation factor Elf1